MRKTKIVCTLGPSSNSEAEISALADAGMNVARINMSHGSVEEHRSVIERVKKVRQKLGLPIGIMVDLKGPEVRIGKFEKGSVLLKKGQTFVLESGNFLGNEKHVSVSSKLLAKSVKPRQKLLLSDGEIELAVQSVQGEKIVCSVKFGGILGNNKSINIPGMRLPLQFLSADDKRDVLLAIESDADFLALSFVESKENVCEMREFLSKNNGSNLKIVSKIESAIGAKHMEEIVEASDGVMVARGDLGVEVDFDELPHIQKRLISLCKKHGKFVITATQMLESMISNSRPTRAEVTDIANAVLDGTDAVMLSGETAVGKHPARCVKTMGEIAQTNEKYIAYSENFQSKLSSEMEVDECVCYAAVASSLAVSAKDILAVTKSGRTAEILASMRPRADIVACTPTKKTLYQMAVLFGVSPLLFKTQKTVEKVLSEAAKAGKNAKLLKEGELVVQLVGVPIGAQTNIVRIENV